MSENIAGIRKNYSQKELSETSLRSTPFQQFEAWWQEALAANLDEVNAMTLATASADGLPSARIVLLKNFSEAGFSFFTNYDSYKGRMLAENPKACLVFFWKELERQVRITGTVKKITETDNDSYFYSRPLGSRTSAVVSAQSQVVPNRDWLEDLHKKISHLTEEEIKRPKNWGGYLVMPVIVEFWQGRPNRLHDRLQYTLESDAAWKIERLAP